MNKEQDREAIAKTLKKAKVFETVTTNIERYLQQQREELADQIISKLPELGWVKRPDAKIICLCGSTRFTPEMLIIQWNFTKQGHVVLSWCALPDKYFHGVDKTHIGDQEGVKEIVDEVHKRKIDLADEVFVVNIGGYIGESTTSEIKYALAHGKLVKFLESEWDYPELRKVVLQ